MEDLRENLNKAFCMYKEMRKAKVNIFKSIFMGWQVYKHIKAVKKYWRES